MRVYIVYEESYSDSCGTIREAHGIYATEERANQEAEILNNSNEYPHIREYLVAWEEVVE